MFIYVLRTVWLSVGPSELTKTGEAEANEENILSGFRLLHLQSIATSIAEAAMCSTCKSSRLILQESLKNRQGIHIPMELVCSSCNTHHSTIYPYSFREESARSE